MRSPSLLYLAQFVLVSVATPVAPGCKDPAIKFIDAVYNQFPVPASKICHDLLKRPCLSPVTKTVQATVTSGTTTVNVNGGRATASSVTTVEVTTKNVATSTATITIPATISSVDTTTTTSTTTSQTTSYTQVYVQNPAKRAAKRNLGQAYPDCPKALRSIAIDVASTACSCFLPPAGARETKTITKTQTVKATVTKTLPAGTTTVVNALTRTTTQDTTTIVSVTTTSTTLAKSTATATATATAFSTTLVTSTYNNVALPNNNCIYNRYYDYKDVSNAPDNGYQAGIDECAGLCNAQATCQFFFVLHFDPAKAGGSDDTSCILDSQPYDRSYLQCGFVNNFNVAYNKGRVVTEAQPGPDVQRGR